MRRIAFLWLPHWSTDLLRQHDGSHDAAAVVLWRIEGPRQLIAAACPRAQGLGLHAGMALAHAQAMVPGLRIAHEDAQADQNALAGLARWCLRYTPLTRALPPDGVWLDLSGCAPLHGGELALLEDLAAHLAGFGLDCRIAVAETPGAAHALAHHAQGRLTIAAAGALVAMLSPLPVTALRIDARTTSLLHRFGIRDIGALAALPRAPLARRLGAQITRQLDRAMGRVFEPIDPALPQADIRAGQSFVDPLSTAESLSAAIAQLAQSLCLHLQACCLGARVLELQCQRLDGSRQTQSVSLALPSAAACHIARLFQERLERIDPGEGIESMALTATWTQPVQPTQTPLRLGLESARPEAHACSDLAPLIDQLGNRLGARRIWRPAPVQSDVPERSVRAVSPLDCRQPDSLSAWPVSLPRPVRLFDPPQPVRTLTTLPDHPPSFFIWRNHRHLVRRADGPERIAGEWWRRPGELRAMRDYFRLEDETGRRYWLFRRGDGEDPATGDLSWFLHGVF